MHAASRAGASITPDRRVLAAVAATLLILTLLAAAPPATASDAAPHQGPWPDRSAADPADRAPTMAQQHQRRVAASGQDPAASAFAAADAIPGELIVTTGDAGDLQQRAFSGWQSLVGPGFVRARPIADRVALVTADPDQIGAVAAALQADPAVLAVEPNIRRAYLATPDDTSFGLQWSHEQTRAATAWDTYTGQGGTAPLIAILDSGVDATHPDLSGVVVAQYQAQNGQVVAGEPVNDTCPFGHGTAVAGSAGAQGNNGFGVAGALWQSRIIDVAITDRATDDCVGPSDSDTIASMSFVSALPETPLAMNLSLGASLSACTAGYQAAVNQARAAGIVVVAAAGNDGTSQTSIPASCDGVISVAATDAAEGRAGYSQTNPQVDIAAPGGDITGPITSCPSFAQLVAQLVITTSLTDVVEVIGGCPAYSDPNGHRLQGISGTSFASPYVAGAVGLLRQLAANDGAPLSVDETEAILQSTARDLGQAGRDCEFGFGVLDLAAAVAAVRSGSRPALQSNASIGSGSCSGPTDPPPPPPTDSCSVTQEPITDGFVRIAASGQTTAVCQAVAVSFQLPSGVAPYAVLARADDFADALAGSAVGLGLGPLLFTSSSGPLDARTESELLRVLNFAGGSPVVYIMGGTAAVPASVDERLSQLGITPVRLAGAGREATAVAASAEVEELKSLAAFETRDYAFVAFGRNFPDAVGAGQMAAYYGIPVLVTNTDSLHPDTRAELQRLSPSRVYVLGGTAVIADGVLSEIAGMGLTVSRLAGGSRVDTTIEVSMAFRDELAADASSGGQFPPLGVAVNLRNNFNDVLSASLIGGNGNLFMPLEGEDGSIMTDRVAQSFCGMGDPLIVVGGTDRVTDASARLAADVVQGSGC